MIELVDARGRKYLTKLERERFLAATRSHPKLAVQTLARTLALTGCRVSEAFGLRLNIRGSSPTDGWRRPGVPESGGGLRSEWVGGPDSPQCGKRFFFQRTEAGRRKRLAHLG